MLSTVTKQVDIAEECCLMKKQEEKSIQRGAIASPLWRPLKLNSDSLSTSAELTEITEKKVSRVTKQVSDEKPPDFYLKG